MGWRELFDEAAGRQGCVTLSMAERHGVSTHTLLHRAHREGWESPFPGVRVCPGAPTSRHQQVAAAVLHCDDAALAGGWTAAWLWDAVRMPPNPTEVLIAHPQSKRAHRKIRTLRTRTLTDDDRTEIDGVPATTLARTIADLSGRASRSFLRGMIIDGRQRKQLLLPAVVDAAERRRPARGATTLLDLCWELDEERCESVFEHLVRDQLRRWGFPPPALEPVTVDTPTGRVQVDIAWPALRIGIETDGFGFHSARAHLDTDQRRHNGLMLGSWRVLRIGWWRFETDWPSFADELSSLFGQAVAAR